MDLNLEMYEIGLPRGCMVVLYLGCGVEFGVVGVLGVVMCVVGGSVWYVFGWKTTVAGKSALYKLI